MTDYNHYLRIKNTVAGNPLRPVGTPLYYPFPPTKLNGAGATVSTTCDDGFEALQKDITREVKIVTTLPALTDASWLFTTCDAQPTTHHDIYVKRLPIAGGGGSLVVLAYRPLVVKFTAGSTTQTITLAAGSYTSPDLVPANFPATYSAIVSSLPDATYQVRFEQADGTLIQTLSNFVVSPAGPVAGYDITDVPVPPQTARAQILNSTAILFNVNGTTHTGFPFFDAVDGTSAPAISASNVYFVDRANDTESLSEALSRVRAGNVTRFLQSAVSNVRAIPTGGGNDPFLNHNISSRRLGGLRMYLANQNTNGGMADFDAEMLAHSVSLGCNYAYLHVGWGHVERTTFGQYDWRLLDSSLAKAKQLGILVFLHIDGSRSENGNDETSGTQFIPDDEQMRDQGGNLLRGGGNRVASYNSTLVHGRFDAFVALVLNRVKNSEYASIIAAVSTSASTQFEAEYTTRNTIGGVEQIPAMYDFSPRSLDKFRERAQAKYTAGISALNSAWGTSFGSFGAVTFPSMGATDGFFNQWQRDFYNHRQLNIAEFLNRQHALIKSISPNLYTIFEFGSLYAEAERRGTIALANLLQADGVKQNDDLGSPLRRSIALNMRDYAPNRFSGTEMDCSQGNNSDRQNQLKNYFNYGGHYFNLFSFYTADPRNGPEVMVASKAKLTELLSGVFSETPLSVGVTNSYQASITVSATRLLNFTWTNGNPQAFVEFDDATENGTKRVRINITQDL